MAHRNQRKTRMTRTSIWMLNHIKQTPYRKINPVRRFFAFMVFAGAAGKLRRQCSVDFSNSGFVRLDLLAVIGENAVDFLLHVADLRVHQRGQPLLQLRQYRFQLQLAIARG